MDRPLGLIKSSINLINFNIVGGFLNLTVSDIYYLDFLDTIKDDLNFGKIERDRKKRDRNKHKIKVESIAKISGIPPNFWRQIYIQ